MNPTIQTLPATEAAAAAPVWSLRARLAYRFATSYFAIFFVPAVLLRPLDTLVAGWLGVSLALMNPGPSGSGDKTVDWVHALTALMLTVVATVAWSVLDRKRREYTTALAWTRLALRYVLASIMMGYGISKVFPMQFQPPTRALLLQRLGDFSPMGLLWAFMGASMGYTIFAGALETLGAILLLFRRTALLGALITAAVLTNVFALNMFYDVPVKLYSFHWLVMALVIAAPDLGRLFRFVVLQKPTDPPSPAGPVFAARDWRAVSWVGKGIILVLLSVQVRGAYIQYAARVALHPLTDTYSVAGVTYQYPTIGAAHTLTGTYIVEGFPGWKQVAVDNFGSMSVTRDNGTITTYRLALDESKSRLKLGNANNPAGSLTFQITGDDMTLEGDLLGEPAKMRLVRSPENSLLLGRGFHWISEQPFNR